MPTQHVVILVRIPPFFPRNDRVLVVQNLPVNCIEDIQQALDGCRAHLTAAREKGESFHVVFLFERVVETMVPSVAEQPPQPPPQQRMTAQQIQYMQDMQRQIQQVRDLPCNVSREGGQSLVIGGASLVILEGKACNPL